MNKNSLAPYEWAKSEMKKNIREFPSFVKNNPAIVFYHSFTTLKAQEDEVPWCSSFMCACAEMGGFKSTRSAAAKSWLGSDKITTLVSVEESKAGDIVILKRVGGNHVAFLHSTYKLGDKEILLLGGNQSNAVRVSKYPAQNILEIRRFKV